MSKRLKITIIVVAALLLAILITTIACVAYARGGEKETEKPDAFYSKWMSYIDSSTLVKDIVIPGTHDSGSYTMSYVAKTQDYSVYDQLTRGVRYLDLRVEKANDGTLYIYHGSVRGVEFETVLEDIRLFLTRNKTETLILDFQHFKGQSQDDVVKALTDKFSYSTYFVNNYSSTTTDDQYIDSLKLSSARGKCIIFWGSDSDSNLDKSYIFKRNDDNGDRAFSALHSYYTPSLNKGTSANYIANGLPTYIEKYKANPVGLFVLQGQLTDGLYIFGPRFRERQHEANMNAYTQQLAESKDLEYINIIMRDFMTGKKSAYILQLNLSKGTVSKTKIETFTEGLAQYIPELATEGQA